MGKFLEAEKQRLISFKTTSLYLSREAQADGIYRGKPRPFCLPRSSAAENLFPDIRHSILAYFADQEIKWHDGQGGNPSNHLCDSQVCCANFLFPFADKPHALTEFLRPIFPTIQQMLPMENAGQFVSFEWIGQRNYLGEKIPRHGKRTRGANFTSADAAVMFEHREGSKQIALIEWKYAESYSSTSLKIAKSGTDRTAIYAHLYKREDFPLDKRLLPSFDALFYAPFYQLFRHQLLAQEMEREQELGARAVSLLHIAPAHNTDFQKVTSPLLRPFGQSVTAVWKKLVKRPDRFTSVSTEEIFSRFPVERFPELATWWEYITTRYSWVQDMV
jgi:hypothetical protein